MKAQKTNAEHQTQSLSEVLPDIGDEIRKVLARKHLSGAWLAVRIGCDRTNIYKILRKKSKSAAAYQRDTRPRFLRSLFP